jgi:hypothetical protein
VNPDYTRRPEPEDMFPAIEQAAVVVVFSAARDLLYSWPGR